MPSTRLPASAYDALGLPEETVKIATTAKPSASPASIASPNLLQNTQEPEQRLAMNDTAITLYAELLLHIRTVTLFASLRTVHTRETKAKLASDGCSITVTHEGTSATIKLPIQVEGGGDAALSLPASPPSKDLNLRLQIEEKEGSNMLGTLLSDERKANIVPWDGASLNSANEVTVHCRRCNEVVVSADVVREWRDLPNENWAEMMDFWHCHKPDEHHLHDHTNEEAIGSKGYAASNRLQATKGVGFVDLASFLLQDGDCTGIETSPASLRCAHCAHILGVPDTASSGHRIWKWCIAISTSSSPTPTSYPPQNWISARLLYLIENQNVRRFHVHPPPPSSSSSPEPIPALLLWVFTPDLFFSSSIDSRSPTRAIKVFWKRETWAAPQPGEVEKADEEEVEVPRELFEELEGALRESQGLIPGSARTFQGWEVGLLGRFDVGHVKGEVGGTVGKGNEEVDL